MLSWQYNGKAFKDPQKYVGFVYLISNLRANKFYIGKKLFTRAAYKQIKGKRKKLRTESDWQDYWGSNDLLQQDVKSLGKKQFKREILRLCKSKSECSYYETKIIFDTDALLRSNFYNYWVSCKITKPHCDKFKIS